MDWTHADLAANIWANADEFAGDGIDDDGNGFVDDIRGWDFAGNDNNPAEEGGSNHGTHVAGIAAARINNATGVAGTAGGATIMPLRISASPTSWTFASAYRYAADNGARIVSTSFGVDSLVSDPTYVSALQYLYDRNVLHINSAGNNNTLNPARQALHQSLFVSNTDSSDVRRSTSNYGTGIDISAPGVSILSTLPGNSYGSMTGTSMSAPNVAGVAALIWSAHPTWTRDQVAAQLIGTADNIDALNPAYAGLLGSGRANAGRAVTETLAAPRIDRLTQVGAGTPTLSSLTGITVELSNVFAESTIESLANWELRCAGANNLFGDGDDVLVALNLATNYMIGTNDLLFQFSSLPSGLYRFTAQSGGLADPFGTSLDGDGNGVGGDDFTRDFIISTASGGVQITHSGGSTAVSEAGATDSYTVVLTSQPTANVTITLNGGSQLQATPSTLTFTSSNWNIAQTVTVSAIDDTLVEGTHGGTIAHSASSGDGGYQGLVLGSVSVTIVDNDSAATGNTAPTPLDDRQVVSGTESTASSGSVLDNDTDADGGALTAILESAPSDGQLTFFNNGSFVYLPGADFWGVDTFAYRASDGTDVSAVATVTLLSQNAALVQKLYQHVLGRDPEISGWQYWAQAIAQGTASLGTIASGIFESNERLDPIISQMYRDYLLREADSAGLDYWRDQVWKRDGSPDQVIAGVVSSHEFFVSAGATNAG